MQAHERVGVVLGDLLDLDAALRREHEERLLRATVERDREVVLLRDVGGLLDPDLLDDVAADVEPDDVARLLLRVRGILGELDAAGLAAAARQHLSLDDDRAAELLGSRPCLLRGRREPPLGDGDSELLEELLALVLVEIHRRADSSGVANLAADGCDRRRHAAQALRRGAGAGRRLLQRPRRRGLRPARAERRRQVDDRARARDADACRTKARPRSPGTTSAARRTPCGARSATCRRTRASTSSAPAART